MVNVNCPALLKLCCLEFSSLEFEMGPLPSGNVYTGPTPIQLDSCKRNTVVYSLVSACGTCQEPTWVQYVFHFAHIKCT